MNELGLIKLNNGAYQDAADHFNQVKLDDIRHFGKGFLHNSILHNLSVAYFRLNLTDLSRSLFERAVQGWKKSNNQLGLGRTYAIFGELFLTIKQYDKAVETYDLAIELLKNFDSEKGLLADVISEKELALEGKNNSYGGD